MRVTRVGRSSFYKHFRDRFGLADALLQTVGDELARASVVARGEGLRQPAMEAALTEVTAVWRRHGPVIRAIADAATHDAPLEALYRDAFLEQSIERVRKAIETGQREGTASAALDPHEAATLLVLAAERYLTDRFGRLPQPKSDAPRATLIHMWTATLAP